MSSWELGIEHKPAWKGPQDTKMSFHTKFYILLYYVFHCWFEWGYSDFYFTRENFSKMKKSLHISTSFFSSFRNWIFSFKPTMICYKLLLYDHLCKDRRTSNKSSFFFCWIVLERRTFFAKWSFLRFLGSLHLKKHFFWVLW